MNHAINHFEKYCFSNKYPIPECYKKYNEDWCLTAVGDMYNVWTDYEIGSDRLNENDWILHLMQKRWFDANTFIPAYFEACRRKGIPVVMIRTYY